MGKKRARLDAIDVESERTLYSSFVAAANSMSQLYSQAVQQQRKASAGASRQTLVSARCALGPCRALAGAPCPCVLALQCSEVGMWRSPCAQERVLGFILKEFPNSEGIPKAALIQFLQQEYEVRSQLTESSGQRAVVCCHSRVLT